MKKIIEYMKNLYLRLGVTFIFVEGDMVIDYDDETEEKVMDAVLSLKDNNYDLYLKILSVLVVCNYISLLDLQINLNKDIDPDDPEFDSSYYETLNPEAIADLTEYAELVEKTLEYINEAQDTTDLDKTATVTGDIESLLSMLLDLNLDSVFEISYPELCSTLTADNNHIPTFRKFISDETIGSIFATGFEYLLKEQPYGLLYTIESFYYFSHSVEGCYEFHEHLIEELLANDLLDNLTVYICELLWDTYKSFKEEDANPAVSLEAREFVIRYETDMGFRESECRKLIFSPRESNVLKLYLEYNDMGTYLDDGLPDDIQTLGDKVNQETADFIRKLIQPKK